MYIDYEEKCNRMIERNYRYLTLFFHELKSKHLSDKTIQKHINNVDLYINNYMLREDVVSMKKGCQYIYLDDFLGNFFIRKCMWSTPASH